MFRCKELTIGVHSSKIDVNKLKIEEFQFSFKFFYYFYQNFNKAFY